MISIMHPQYPSYVDAATILAEHPDLVFVFSSLTDAYLAAGLLFPEPGDENKAATRVAHADANHKANAKVIRSADQLRIELLPVGKE